MLVCDVNIRSSVNDNRRIEIIADGLPIFHGAQLAVDATLISALCADGQPHPGSSSVGGICLDRARRRKERTYPELVDDNRT